MTYRLRLAIDAMGGDFGPEVTLPASLASLAQHRDLHLTLFGDQAQLEARLGASDCPGYDVSRLSLQHTDCVVLDEDIPTRILRDKTGSSMYQAVASVRDGRVQACVSAGNTGALLLSGRHLLKTIPGIDKPAIIATIPGANRNSYLLDVGANVDCKADQLFQFAVMGAVLAESLDGLQQARVALLNIGVEEYKGNEQVKAAAALLEACEAINYIGFVEGSALFEGLAEVVVCDGFVGNVIIKSSAGVVGVINQAMAGFIATESGNKGVNSVSAGALGELLGRIDPTQFNGASLLGLQGSIIKSHGHADVRGFTCAIERAIKEAERNVPALIADKVAEIVGV